MTACVSTQTVLFDNTQDSGHCYCNLHRTEFQQFSLAHCSQC